MTTESVNDEIDTAALARRRSLMIYRRCLVASVIGVVVLFGIGFAIWHLADQNAIRDEHLIVQNTFSRYGGSTPDSKGHVTQLTFVGSTVRPSILGGLNFFPQLKRLAFINVPLAEDDLKVIAGLKSLHELVIIEPPITDKELEQLSRCENLTYLQLTKTEITGAGLLHLSRLVHLRRLDLKKSHVDDRGLKHLQNLTSLEELYLYETDVTDEGVRELQIALPKTLIKR